MELFHLQIQWKRNWNANSVIFSWANHTWCQCTLRLGHTRIDNLPINWTFFSSARLCVTGTKATNRSFVQPKMGLDSETWKDAASSIKIKAWCFWHCVLSILSKSLQKWCCNRHHTQIVAQQYQSKIFPDFNTDRPLRFDWGKTPRWVRWIQKRPSVHPCFRWLQCLWIFTFLTKTTGPV